MLETYGVAVIALSDISVKDRHEAIKKTLFYQNANAIFKNTNQIQEPRLQQKLMMEKYVPPKAPDASSGMLHQYFTPIHHMLHESKRLRDVFDTLSGKQTRYAPNRLRVSNRFKFDDNSLHIEGKNIFEVKDGKIKLLPGEIACIAAISGQRRFVFWDMNGANLRPLYDLWDSHGRKNWTKPDPSWMEKHYKGRRRMVTVDCREQPYLILWSESTPHEIAMSPSLSAFISPVETFDKTKVLREQMTSYHPKEYEGLTRHESNLLGCCYNMPGFTWPSGKKAYAFCHSRAYGFYVDRIKSRYVKEGKRSGRKTFQQELIDIGKIDQHTAEYKEALRKRGIKLPDVAFAKNTPNFIVDLLALSDQILKNYGFIP